MSALASFVASAAERFGNLVPRVPDTFHHPHRPQPTSWAAPVARATRNRSSPSSWNPHPSPTTPPLNNSTTACTQDSITSLLQTFVKTESTVALTVERAVHVTGGTFGEGPSNRAYPQNATNLPEVCAVIVSVINNTASDDLGSRSNYRFGLFLPPAADWNGRFLAVGNGGQNGGTNWPEMGQGPHYGFATVSTDTGHSSNDATDGLMWALNRPDRVLDWGYRAVRGSVAVAKQIVRAYYHGGKSRADADRKKKMWSYWSGCSTGGRQGLKAIQDDPDSFDGALVGAPAWDTKHLFPWIAKIGRDNLRDDGTIILDAIDPSIMVPLAARVQLLCDAADGVVDGIISAPERCAAINMTSLACPAGLPAGTPGCLTPEQAGVVRKVWADYFVSDGKDGGLRLANNGFEVGSELQWYIFLGGSAPSDFDTQFERYLLYNDTTWSWRDFSNQVVLDSERINPGQAAADDYDVSAFRERGGKVLMYHGLADGIVPSRSSTLYYNRTLGAMGGGRRGAGGVGVDGFLRHFQVPGMQHCAFTPATVNAPWMFAGAGQATWLQLLDPALTTPDVRAGWGTPGFRGDPEYDALLKLMAWTEGGEAPDSINAVAYNADWSVYRTRKLCPYPQRAKLTGLNPNVASSWTCVEGYNGIW
ncbi:hypothetical protein RB598_009473 [Gaeumannomyces tritici]